MTCWLHWDLLMRFAEFSEQYSQKSIISNNINIGFLQCNKLIQMEKNFSKQQLTFYICSPKDYYIYFTFRIHCIRATAFSNQFSDEWNFWSYQIGITETWRKYEVKRVPDWNRTINIIYLIYEKYDQFTSYI